MGFEVIGTVDIGRPVGDVFAFLSDFSNNPKWEKGLEEMEFTTPGPLAVGSKGRRVENMMGRDEGTFEITEFEQDKHVGLTFESQRFKGSGQYDLESIDAGTRLNYRFVGDAKGMVWKLLIPLMAPMIKRSGRKDFLRLKSLVEGGS